MLLAGIQDIAGWADPYKETSAAESSYGGIESGLSLSVVSRKQN